MCQVCHGVKEATFRNQGQDPGRFRDSESSNELEDSGRQLGNARSYSEIALVEEKLKRELQRSFSFYTKIKVSDDTARYPANTEVKFGSSPVIENKPINTCRRTSDLTGSHSVTHQKASFSDCLGVKHAVDPPHVSAAVSSKSWLRGNFDGMPTTPDEDLYKPNRLESKSSRVGAASANAHQDNTALEEIRNMTKVLHQGSTLQKTSLPQFDGNPQGYYQFMRRFERSVMKQVDSPSQLEFLIEMCSGEAREAVKSYSIVNLPSLGLKQALEVLRQKYGLKHTMVKAHLDCITRGQTVKSDKQSLLDRFASELHNCTVTMKAWRFESELDSSHLKLYEGC